MRVLLVEDDASLREGMGELISEFAEVHAVSTAEDAVAALQSERFFLVITDLRISGGEPGGRIVVDAARQRQQPVAVVSASTPEEVMQAILPHVADAILLKPFQIDDIVALVERFIALRQDVERLATQGDHPPASAWSSQGAHVNIAREAEQSTVWVSLTAGADLDWTFRPAVGGAGIQVIEGSLQVDSVTYSAGESFFLGAGQAPRVRSPDGCLAVAVGLKGQG